MELAIMNNPDTANIEGAAPLDPDEYEKEIESMSEDLVTRMTRLHIRCGALRLSSMSHKEREKIQAWAGKENDDLLLLKETIRRRKQSYVKTIPTHLLVRLGNHHPVWKTHYDVYMDQIERTTLTREGDTACIRCTLNPTVLTSLKIFSEAGGGKILCVNSDRGLYYKDIEQEAKDGVRWMLLNDTFYPLRRNMFRMVERIRAQWVFTDEKWGISGHVLWLAFGKG